MSRLLDPTLSDFDDLNPFARTAIENLGIFLRRILRVALVFIVVAAVFAVIYLISLVPPIAWGILLAWVFGCLLVAHLVRDSLAEELRLRRGRGDVARLTAQLRSTLERLAYEADSRERYGERHAMMLQQALRDVVELHETFLHRTSPPSEPRSSDSRRLAEEAASRCMMLLEQLDRNRPNELRYELEALMQVLRELERNL